MLFGIPEAIIPETRASFAIYMKASLAELESDLHPQAVEVVSKLQELANGWTNLPLLAMPFAPLLAFYTAFNFAAVDSTLPSLARCYGRTPTEQPGPLLGATRAVWSRLPNSIRHALLESQRHAMLPLGDRFAKRLQRAETTPSTDGGMHGISTAGTGTGDAAAAPRSRL